MGLYYSKDRLYKEIANLKNFLGIDQKLYGFNLVEILINGGLKIESIPLQTAGLRGMAVIGQENEEDIILLNSHRTNLEQNFDCGHEMIHLAIHRKLDQKTFNCFESVTSYQDPFIEWQANEGAAEFFVPYKILIEYIGDCYKSLNNYSNIEMFKETIACIFNVPEAVIKYRLENLKYEIHQYLSGIPLNDIEILSAKKQNERNIMIKSLNQISDEDFANSVIEYSQSTS